MIKELNEEFLPDTFLFREGQYNQLSNIFELFKTGKGGDNILIQGVTGSGKTSLIKKVISENEQNIYVSCKNIDSTKKLFSYLNGNQKGVKSDLVDEFVLRLKKEKKVLIIDEAHHIKDTERFGENLDYIYREVGIPIILITNQFNFLGKIPDDARLTLHFQPLYFPCYNAIQLQEILAYRLSLIKDYHINFPEHALALIPALVHNDYFSSVRTVLYIANKCIQNNCYTQSFIRAVANQLKNEEAIVYVERMSRIEKLFLEGILEVGREKNKITTKDIQQQMPNFGMSRISQLITIFVDEYRIIQDEYENLGRRGIGGRRRVLTFTDQNFANQLYQALHPEEFFEEKQEILNELVNIGGKKEDGLPVNELRSSI